jgi:hypothetical protein
VKASRATACRSASTWGGSWGSRFILWGMKGRPPRLACSPLARRRQQSFASKTQRSARLTSCEPR